MKQKQRRVEERRRRVFFYIYFVFYPRFAYYTLLFVFKEQQKRRVRPRYSFYIVSPNRKKPFRHRNKRRRVLSGNPCTTPNKINTVHNIIYYVLFRNKI